MDSKLVLILSSFIGILVIWVSTLLSAPIAELVRTGFGSGVDGRKVKRLIGVMSSLKRQERRTTIRQTWKKLSSGPPHSSVFFAMPEKSCPVDPFWRIRESVCAEWRVRTLPIPDEDYSYRPLTVVTTNSRDNKLL